MAAGDITMGLAATIWNGSEKMGGPGKTVQVRVLKNEILPSLKETNQRKHFQTTLTLHKQIDETKIGKRKDNRGRRAKGMWILGITSEEERGRFILEVIDTREIQSIIPIIQKHVAVGTTIKTDCLRTYDCLNDLGYKHIAINHSDFLVDPWTGANTNLIEGSWLHFKASLPKSGLHSVQKCYTGYLYQFTYQRLVRYQYPDSDPLLVFLRLWGEALKKKNGQEEEQLG